MCLLLLYRVLIVTAATLSLIITGSTLMAGPIYETGGQVIPAMLFPNKIRFPEKIEGKNTDYRAQLAFQIPVTTPSFGDSLFAQFSGFMNVFGGTPSTADRIKVLQPKFYPPARDYDLSLRQVATAPQVPSTNSEELKQAAGLSSREVLMIQLLHNYSDYQTIYQKLKSGLNFELKLSRLWEASPPPRLPRPVRYGLVLDHIEPTTTGMNQAALEDNWENAGRARPIWTIGPVHDDHAAHLYQVRIDEYAYSPWGTRLEIPRPDFKLAFAPSTIPNSIQGGATIPGAKLSLTQDQKYYQLDYQVDNRLKKQSLDHLFTMPLKKELRVQQAYNEARELQRTSLLNLLLEINRPALNLNYLNREKRFTCDLKMTRARQELVMTADTPRGFKPFNNFGSKDAERYEVKYILNF